MKYLFYCLKVISVICYQLLNYSSAIEYQEMHLIGKISHSTIRNLYIYTESKLGMSLIDSVTLTQDDKFHCKIVSSNLPGLLYITGAIRLMIFVSSKVDTIEFETTVVENKQLLTKFNDYDNSEFAKYSNICQNYIRKSNSTKQFIDQYPENDKYFKKVVHLQTVLNKEFNKMLKVNSRNWNMSKGSQYVKDYIDISSHLLKNELGIELLNPSKYKYYLCYSNSHKDLINTDILEDIVLSYLSQVNISRNFETVNEFIYITYFDSLLMDLNLDKQIIDKVNYTFIKFLQANKYYKALSIFLKNDYNSEIGKNETRKLEIGERLINIKGTSKEGFLLSLNDYTFEYKVLFIWSPDCDHCINTIAGLNDLYSDISHKRVEFYAFSLNKQDSSIIKRIKWANSSYLLNSWDNEFMKTYKVNYTPIIVLVDSNNKIIELPSDILQLQLILKKLNLLNHSN